MAIDIEREPIAFPIQDDPMRIAPRNGNRPIAQIADPAPLGLAALGLTLMIFSMFNAGLLARSGEPVVLGMALAYGGLAQLLAGMWEFRRGNSFGAMTFASYGAFWLSFWLLEQFFVGRIPAGERGSAVGLYFIAWAIFTVLLWVASTRTTAVVSVMLRGARGVVPAARHRRCGIARGAGQDRRLVRTRRHRGRAVRRVCRGDQRHLRAHVAAAGAARTGPHERMTRRGPAYQPIAGWRKAVRTATLVAMDRSLDPPRRSLPTGPSGVVAAPDHPLNRWLT